MTKPIKAIQAIRHMVNDFPPSADAAKMYHQFGEDYYISQLRLIKRHIPFRKQAQNYSCLSFLYAGCLRFNRFLAPSPYIIHPEMAVNFELFLDPLMLLEGIETNNTAQFQVHRLCGRLLSYIDEVPLEEISIDYVNKIAEQLTMIKSPSHPIKVNEFEKAFKDLNNLIQSIRDGNLRSIYKTRIPYVFHTSELSLSMIWKHIPITMKLTPTFSNSVGASMVNTDSAMLPVGSSRWQSGFTEIEITFAAFIDGGVFSDSLQASEGHDHPESGWPKCFTVAFELIYEASWKIREFEGSEQQWIPAPRDLGFMDTRISVSENIDLFQIVKDPPSNQMKIFTPVRDVVEIELGELSPMKWSNKGRLLCSMYLDIGDTNEAIFWLNVATEALIKERINQIAIETSNPSLCETLNSPKAFWDSAEEIISDQYPDMAGMVKWPDSKIHISVFSKIK